MGCAGKTRNLLWIKDMNIDLLKTEIEASIKVKHKLLEDEKLLGMVLDVSRACLKTLLAGGKIIFCGNTTIRLQTI